MSNEWTLISCDGMRYVECTSGLAFVITVNHKEDIRVDVMRGLEPVMSFIGKDPRQIRRCMEYWFAKEMPEISMSHACYLGSELECASVEGLNYEQR